MKIQGVPAQNPMLNHVVLERIFQHAEYDTKSFANYRLVCKLWNEISLKKWRKNTWLPVTTCRQHDGVHVEDFLELFKSDELRLASVPFTKYKIIYWCGAIHYYLQDKPERLEFWETVGPLMTHLFIKATHFYFNDNFRKILFELTPNLQSLALENNYYMIDEPTYNLQTFDPKQEGLKVNENLKELKFNFGKWENIIPVTWMELFWHFPNVEILEPMFSDPKFNPSLWIPAGLLKNIELLRNTVGSHYFQNVTVLRLCTSEQKCKNAFTLDFALLLKRLKFPLKILTLDVGPESEARHVKESLRTLLESHAETLEELTLERLMKAFPFPDFPFGINFPKLTKFSSTAYVVQNFGFLKYMPSLEHLSLIEDEQRIHLYNERLINLVVNTNVKEFKITKRFCFEKELIFFGKLMPNLTIITLGLKKTSSFSAVCRLWKDVTHLNIYTRDSKNDEYWKSEKGDEYIQSNISDLLELRCLKIGEGLEYSE